MIVSHFRIVYKSGVSSCLALINIAPESRKIQYSQRYTFFTEHSVALIHCIFGA